MAKSEKLTPWEIWKQALPSCVIQALQDRAKVTPAYPEETEDYQTWRNQLPGSARERVDQLVETGSDELQPIDPFEMSYCAVVCPDGEFPRCLEFASREVMARQLAVYLGQDVAVIPFLGTPLPITVGPQRYVLLPDDRAISIPLAPGHRVVEAEASLLGQEIQEDWFLGRPELAITSLKATLKSATSRPKDDEEVEDQDEDEDWGVGEPK